MTTADKYEDFSYFTMLTESIHHQNAACQTDTIRAATDEIFFN